MIDSMSKGYINKLNVGSNLFADSRTIIRTIPTIAGYDLNAGEVVFAKRENNYYFGHNLEEQSEFGPDCCDGGGGGPTPTEEVELLPSNAGVSDLYTNKGGIYYGLTGRSYTSKGGASQVVAANGTVPVSFPLTYFDSWDNRPSPTPSIPTTNGILPPPQPWLTRGLYLVQAFVNWEPNASGEVGAYFTFGGLGGPQYGGVSTFTTLASQLGEGAWLNLSYTLDLLAGPIEVGLEVENTTNGGRIKTTYLCVSLAGR